MFDFLLTHDDDQIMINHKTKEAQATALHQASVSHRSFYYISALAKRPSVDCNAVNKYGSTPLMQAVAIQNKWYVKLLLTNCKNLDITIKSSGGNTALHQAIYKNSLDVFEQITASGQSLDAVNNHGKTALHLAVKKLKVDYVRELMNNNADPNLKDNSNQYPLFMHWKNSNIDETKLVEMAELLLDGGADPTLKPWIKLVQTSYDRYASGSQDLKDSYLNVLEKLVQNGADIYELVDGKGVICKMVYANKEDALRRIAPLVDLDKPCWSGNRKYPLHIAVLSQKNDIAKLLMDSGASLTLKDNFGATPVSIARKKNPEFYAEHFANRRRS